MKSNCKVILQARVSSTRLPKKTILDFFDNKGILELLIERIKLVIPSQDIIIATSTNLENEAIVDVAKKTNVNFYRGDENDVLKRFIDAANHFNAKNIVRICSDNLFLDIQDLKKLYTLGLETLEYDYIAYKVNSKPNILTHYGLWGELTTLKSLEKASKLTSDSFYHEHVTNYIYKDPSIFKIKWLTPLYVPKSNNIRLTIDTYKDFNIQKPLFAEIFQKFGLDFSVEKVIDIINKDSDIKKVMLTEIQKNEK